MPKFTVQYDQDALEDIGQFTPELTDKVLGHRTGTAEVEAKSEAEALDVAMNDDNTARIDWGEYDHSLNHQGPVEVSIKGKGATLKPPAD